MKKFHLPGGFCNGRDNRGCGNHLYRRKPSTLSILFLEGTEKPEVLVNCLLRECGRTGRRNYVELDPEIQLAHIFLVRR